MGTQHRSSLSERGQGSAHYASGAVRVLEDAMEKEVDETGKKVAIEVLKSVAKNDPLIRTALSAYECINTIEKIDHYAEIADEKGAASAAGEFVKDTAKQVVKDYSTDVVTDTIVNSGVINSNQREQVQRVVGMVVDYGVDKAEEAFLNE